MNKSANIYISKLTIANAANVANAVYCFAARAEMEFLAEITAAANARGSHIPKMQMNKKNFQASSDFFFILVFLSK